MIDYNTTQIGLEIDTEWYKNILWKMDSPKNYPGSKCKIGTYETK